MNMVGIGRAGKVASEKAVVTVAVPIGDLGLSRRGAERLLEYLKDVGAVIGYKVPHDTRVRETFDDDGPSGHSVELKNPSGGFQSLQRANIHDYVRALGVYNGLEYTVDWGETAATISFRPLEQTLPVSAEDSLRARMRDLFLPYVYKACRAMGKSLVGQGFRVREPVPATLITYNAQVSGFAIIVKYPFPKAEDEAGITEVYNRMLPFIADAHARGLHLRAETLKEGDVTMMFFTRSRRFVPSIYETRSVLRPVIVRRQRTAGLQFAFMSGSTHRACRKLATSFKKDFNILTRPLPALHVKGHTVVLRYKQGAGGKLVHDSYTMVVGRAADSLATKYHIQASVRHSEEARMLVVTFHCGVAPHWDTSRVYL